MSCSVTISHVLLGGFHLTQCRPSGAPSLCDQNQIRAQNLGLLSITLQHAGFLCPLLSIDLHGPLRQALCFLPESKGSVFFLSQSPALADTHTLEEPRPEYVFPPFFFLDSSHLL